MSMRDGLSERAVPRLGSVCAGGKTRQSFRQECDINAIVDKARRTGLVSHVNSKQPTYRDVSDIPDYATALKVVDRARETFLALPSKIRERFANDPSKMLDFMADKNNFDEAVKLGLFVKREPVVEKVQKVEVVNSADPKPKA